MPRCPLWRNATQTVFGEGRAPAAMMLVGEQPGDKEDVVGHPFVGPAGRILGQALTEAGINRRSVYITNAVKHFKNEPRGKRRLHKKPNATEIEACRWWLDKESKRLMHRPVVIGRMRGKAIESEFGSLWITIHPSFVLRQQDRTSRQREFRRFVKDLAGARASLASATKGNNARGD